MANFYEQNVHTLFGDISLEKDLPQEFDQDLHRFSFNDSQWKQICLFEIHFAKAQPGVKFGTTDEALSAKEKDFEECMESKEKGISVMEQCYRPLLTPKFNVFCVQITCHQYTAA